LVQRLVDESREAGAHAATWHGRDNQGRAVPSGVYFARLRSGNVVMTQRLTLIR
jgi:flagellar hook assembly protein FlgD